MTICNEHTAKHTPPGLLQILDDLPLEKRPKLVRGDSAFGNDPLMTALEERSQPYLFKLKLSKNVKPHIGSLFRQSGWTDAGQGWEQLNSTTVLSLVCDHLKHVLAGIAPPSAHRLLANNPNGIG